MTNYETAEMIKYMNKEFKETAGIIQISGIFHPDMLKVGEPFTLLGTRIDKTHINCKNKESLISLFKSFGYKSFLKLNLNSIYDSKGCLCLLII